MIVNDPMFT